MNQIDYMPALQQIINKSDMHFALTQDRTQMLIVLLLIVIGLLAWVLARVGALRGTMDKESLRANRDIESVEKIITRLDNHIQKQTESLNRQNTLMQQLLSLLTSKLK